MMANVPRERAPFFSITEQELLIEGFEEHKDILTTKCNTVKASKLREQAWQRIADKIHAANPSGTKRTWEQVKTKYKNILQTANKKKTEQRKTGMPPAVPDLTPAETPILLSNTPTIKVEAIPEGISSQPVPEGSNNSVSVLGHVVTLMPVPPDTEGEMDDADGYEEIIFNNSLTEQETSSNAQERPGSTGVSGEPSIREEPEESVRSLYKKYLRIEMLNREQEMKYRTLKMLKVEKEIQLLDKQLLQGQLPREMAK